MDVVWLKKDVRLRDHAPLSKALSSSERPVLILYVYEDDQLQHHSVHGSHIFFSNEGLADVEEQLCTVLGTGKRCITLVRGEITAALEAVSAAGPGRIVELLSHEETGHLISYERDKRVRRWCKKRGVVWREFQQNGIIRGLKDRVKADFAKRWTAHMTSKIPGSLSDDDVMRRQLENRLIRGLHCQGSVDSLLSPTALGLKFPEDRHQRQKGGEFRSLELLHSFLTQRGENFSADISSPISAWNSCCRLSPYFTFGHISVRYVVHAVGRRQQEIRALSTELQGRHWLKSLAAFQSRLRWRSHFMQKLETEPEIEVENQCRAFDALRTSEGDWNEEYFQAWAAGKTGFPMVDACMRCLLRSGWMNFRMRAMLTSFACYNLWLDWRGIAPHLARCFLDYEPGIHYPQLQMQAGVTGINALRVYSATKQGIDQDPKGQFIRQYVQELLHVPDKYIHEPWTMPEKVQEQARCCLGIDYPYPIVDEKETAKLAKERIGAIGRDLKTKAEAQAVYDRHGSRMSRQNHRKISNGEYTSSGSLPKRQKVARPEQSMSIEQYMTKSNEASLILPISTRSGNLQESLGVTDHAKEAEKALNAKTKKHRSEQRKQAKLTEGWGQLNWACSSCTFINPGGISSCQMCRTPALRK